MFTKILGDGELEKIMREAVLAERERCAKIAETAYDLRFANDDQLGNGSPDAWAGYNEAAIDIAKRIRSGK